MPPAETREPRAGSSDFEERRLSPRSLTWWQEQCVWRGIKRTLTLRIKDYQDALRGHENDPICKEILELEESENLKFRMKNAEERTWRSYNNDKKAEVDPEKFLCEYFDLPRRLVPLPLVTKRPWVSVVVKSYRSLGAAALDLGLFSGWTEAPRSAPGNQAFDTMAVVIAQDEVHIKRALMAIEKEVAVEKEKRKARAKQEEKAEQQELPRKRKSDVGKTPTSRKLKAWDVRGTTEDFYLGKFARPSRKHPSWNYRWRGAEYTGEMIEYDDVRRGLFTLTFCSSEGTELMGTFGGGPFEKCTFSGTQMQPQNITDPLDIDEEWESLNYAAYEEARKKQWA